MRLPPQAKVTRRYLGLGQNRVVSLRFGGSGRVLVLWQKDGKVISPSSVRRLERYAFRGRKELRELAFEEDSMLRSMDIDVFRYLAGSGESELPQHAGEGRVLVASFCA